MKRYGNKEEIILGVSASSRLVHAVLLRDTPEGPEILRHFSRERDETDPFSMPTPVPDDVSSDDVSLQFGDQSASDTGLFLASEFDGLSDADADNVASESPEYVAPHSVPIPFDKQLTSILKECEDAGYERPRIAFALTSEFLGSTSFEYAPEGESGSSVRKKTSSREPKRDELLKQLRQLKKEPISEEKSAFLPMRHSAAGETTHLAVYALSGEPISPTLKSIRDRTRHGPDVALIDTEISLFFGLARAVRLERARSIDEELEADENTDVHNPTPNPVTEEPDDLPTTLVVRIGVEDTLVMFIEDDELIHFENLRSITAYDPPETVCSRVLLLQDEFGAGDADHILLLGVDREADLIANFREFFVESDVSSIRSILPPTREDLQQDIGREGVLASAAALRLVKDELYESVFLDVDFLDKSLRGPIIRLPFSWSVAAMIVVLFGTSLFFVHRFFTQQHELEMRRYELQHYPESVVDANATLLQAQIDSLTTRTEGLIESLDLLDELLVGSDRWSRALEAMAVNSADIHGLWVETMNESEGVLKLTGSAMDRTQVVAFASYSGAVIESLESSEIRDWPVWTFTISVPMEAELPEAARYLREDATDNDDGIQAAILDSTSTRAVSADRPTRTDQSDDHAL